MRLEHLDGYVGLGTRPGDGAAEENPLRSGRHRRPHHVTIGVVVGPTRVPPFGCPVVGTRWSGPLDR